MLLERSQEPVTPLAHQTMKRKSTRRSGVGVFRLSGSRVSAQLQQALAGGENATATEAQVAEFQKQFEQYAIAYEKGRVNADGTEFEDKPLSEQVQVASAVLVKPDNWNRRESTRPRAQTCLFFFMNCLYLCRALTRAGPTRRCIIHLMQSHFGSRC